MNKTYCRFNARVVKAYVDPETGLKTIEAIASDDKIDYYEERFAETAIDDMVYASRQRKALKPEEGLVGLQVSHWEVFEIGFALDGVKLENSKNNSKEFKVTLALKAGVWQADELYNDIREKRIDKQLSVGGYIPDFEKDYTVEEETFTNSDGEEVKIMVGIINKFVLEHIAVTEPNGAANPRTEFITAKSKDFGYKNGSIYKSANSDSYQKLFKSKEDKSFKDIVNEVKNTVRDTMKSVFKEREDEQMKIVEKAKKKIEELRKLVEDNSEELDTEALKSLGFGFVSEEEEPVVEPEVEVIVKSISEEDVDAKIETYNVTMDEKLEVIKGLIPEKVEIPEIPEDNSEKVKSLEEKLEALTIRLKAIEDADSGSQVVEDTVNEDTDEDNEDNEEEIVVKSDPNDKLAAWR